MLCTLGVLAVNKLIGLLQPLSLLLKASPLIDELSLYDVVNTPGVTADLSHISSIAVHTSALLW